MQITIREYTDAMIQGVQEFNDRLKAGGVQSQFPTSPVSAWLPKAEGRKLFQEYYVASDENSMVRGAYVLKHQGFYIGGKDGKNVSIADFQLPISEGVVDKADVQVGAGLLLDAQQKQPLLYGLGMGGYDEDVTRLLAAAGWNMFSVPFFFRIVRPFGFLRNIAYLRRSVHRRHLADMLAFTGLGRVAVKALQFLCDQEDGPGDSVKTETADEFADWADRLWEDCKDQYGMSAVRDCETLRILYPREKEKFIRLKVTEGPKVIGWAVLLDTQLSAHKQFGNMRLGSIVDCFASTVDTGKVVRSARTMLEKRGVDLIVSNQAHTVWCQALDKAGFMQGPSNFIFASSKKLTHLLSDAGVNNSDIHMTRGDGDGPINL